MKTYSQEEILGILAKHRQWLAGEDGGIRAVLRGADLSGAVLRGADLSGADLSGACNLWGVIGNSRNIKTVQTNNWVVVYTATDLQIGCQKHPINDWWSFDDEQIGAMSDDAVEWWGVWKPIIQKIIEVSPAEPTN